MLDLRRMRFRESPYPLAEIDDCLPADLYAALKADMPALEDFQARVRMHGDLSSGDAGYDALLARSAAWKALHDWVYSARFAEAMFTLFAGPFDRLVHSGELLFDPRSLTFDPSFREGRTGRVERVAPEDAVLYGRLDLGYGIEGYGRVNGGKGVHVDNWPRLVSCLLYFSDNSDFDGGEFCIYAMRPATMFRNARMTRVAEIRCAENRAILSLQTNASLHAVNEVLAARKPRYAAYFALSCNARAWRPMENPEQAALTQSRRLEYESAQSASAP